MAAVTICSDFGAQENKVCHCFHWCFQSVVLEKTLESPLDSKEIKPVNPKGNQSWIFIGRTNAKADVPILWPPDAKKWLIGNEPDAGKDWRQKGTTEDEMVGWHHRLEGHELEQASVVGNRQGDLACCSPWGLRVGHDWATELKLMGFPGDLVVKNLPANATDMDSISRSQSSPREGNGYPLQCSCLGNPMDRGAWRATVCGVAKSQKWLSNQVSGAVSTEEKKGSEWCRQEVRSQQSWKRWGMDSPSKNWFQTSGLQSVWENEFLLF